MLHKKFIAYIIASFIVALFLSRKTDKKILSFTFVFWILASPVLSMSIMDAPFIIDFQSLPFDLQPNRILLLFLGLYLLFETSIGSFKHQFNARTHNKKPRFEILIYIYLTLIILSIVMNYSNLDVKQQILTKPLEILLFILVYQVAKKKVTPSVNEAIMKTLVLLGLFSASLAVFQIMGNEHFLKTCRDRLAFGPYVRSTAIFDSEYSLGFLLIFAIIVILARIKKKQIRYYCVALLLVGIVTTFHRLTWIICLVSLGAYFIAMKRLRPVFVIVSILPVIYLIFPLFSNIITKNKNYQTFVEKRILKDTVTERFLQYEIGYKLMSKHFFGLGGYDNKIYFKTMERAEDQARSLGYAGAYRSMIRTKGNPVVIHNGFIATGVKYGVLSMLVFFSMLASMIFYYKKRIEPENGATLYPFFIALIWAIANLSNDLSDFNLYFIILVGLILGSSEAHYGNPSFQRDTIHFQQDSLI